MPRSSPIIAAGAALCLLFSATAPASAQCDPEVLSHRGGAPQCVDRVGNRVYCVFGDELSIIDITNVAVPRLLGSVIIPGGDVRDIAVANGYAYIVANHNGFIVVDISTAASPAIVSTVPAKQSLTDIVVADGKAYACGGESGDERVFILDLVDPAVPLVASIYIVSDGFTKGVAARGDMLYVGGGSSVDILDVSNPATPALLSTYEAVASVQSLAVAGDTLFIETVTELEIVDVSNGFSPAQLSTYDPQEWGQVAVNPAGTLAYVQGFGSVDVIDVSSPAAPVLRATIEYVHGDDLLATGSYLYHADPSDGLVLWDCTNAASPTQLWTIDRRPTSPTTIAANDSWLVFAENQELVVFNTTVPGTPTRLAAIALGSNSAVAVLSGDLLYETDRSAGLQIFDLAAVGGPVVIGTAPTGLYPEKLALEGSILMVALYDGTLQLFDVSNPTAPFLRSSAPSPTADSPRAMVVENGYVYMLGYSSGVNIFDVRDPDAPVFLRTITATDEAYHVSLRDGVLCVTRTNPFGAHDTIIIYDVTDPANPAYRGTFLLTSSYGSSTAFHDSTLVVSESGTGLHFVDISDPSVPRVIRDFPMGSGAALAVPTSDRLWVLGTGSGLWELSLPGDPRVIADPQDTEVCAGFISTFETEAVGAAAYFWRRNGVPLANGPTGNGSVIAGAFTNRLVIAGTTPADAGEYDCAVLNSCGYVRTTSATLGTTACCAADFNQDGIINSSDFFAFVNAFFAGDIAADMNADGSVNSQDVFDFIGAFFAGC